MHRDKGFKLLLSVYSPTFRFHSPIGTNVCPLLKHSVSWQNATRGQQANATDAVVKRGKRRNDADEVQRRRSMHWLQRLFSRTIWIIKIVKQGKRDMKRPTSRVAVFSILLVAIIVFLAISYAWNSATEIFQPANAHNPKPYLSQSQKGRQLLK